MNRRALERYLRSNGCELHHHGARHDVWINSLTLALSPVPRHASIKKGTVRGICRLLGVSPPSGL
ncbi:MAG: type II toxin-antitoxin system HicA family toxin [Planctomycetota bacterium]